MTRSESKPFDVGVPLSCRIGRSIIGTTESQAEAWHHTVWPIDLRIRCETVIAA